MQDTCALSPRCVSKLERKTEAIENEKKSTGHQVSFLFIDLLARNIYTKLWFSDIGINKHSLEDASLNLRISKQKKKKEKGKQKEEENGKNWQCKVNMVSSYSSRVAFREGKAKSNKDIVIDLCNAFPICKTRENTLVSTKTNELVW